MHINRLRLLGFKSFVEPTELPVEKGLTGVVGPNGCGKSNLLEALRWVMGETSHKSMRAAAMEDVIFSGTAQRPARNTAEVTIFIDNSTRQAPAEYNGDDMVEVTRRIERDAGSAFRINGREVRARDVRILFEDAATGARSPALVRQGQIGELVNAKPEQRRRVLEDAAGIAGLHSRRHEAELRLKAADGNLARLSDILGQLKSQIESLRRQARQARRYKELSAEIRRLEAILLHLRWTRSASPGRCRGGRPQRGAGEGCPRHRGRGEGGEGGGRGRRRPAAPARPGGGQGRHPLPLQDRAGEPRARGRAHRRARARARLARRPAQPRPRAGRFADRRGQGEPGAARGGKGLARQHVPPRRRLRAEGACRLRGGGGHPQRRGSALEPAHRRHRRGARAAPEPRWPEERARGPDRQARPAARRAGSPDARDRGPRPRRRQAQGRRRARPAADGRDCRHRGQDAGRGGCGAGRGRRRQGQERGGRRSPSSRPASSRPRWRRSPSFSYPPATPACRPSSTRSRWRPATRWRSPPRSATTSMRLPRTRRPRTGASTPRAAPTPRCRPASSRSQRTSPRRPSSHGGSPRSASLRKPAAPTCSAA